VPLVVIAPPVGIAIVPVTLPVGAGLTPSDVISVASIGIPAAPTDPPGLIPRGEVVPSEGIAVSGSSTSTWANAGLAHSKGQAVATIKKRLMEGFPDKSVSASPHSMASVRVIRPRWSWQRGNSIKKAFIVRTSSNTRLSLRARRRPQLILSPSNKKSPIFDQMTGFAEHQISVAPFKYVFR
jgi:hypothetical protein